MMKTPDQRAAAPRKRAALLIASALVAVAALLYLNRMPADTDSGAAAIETRPVAPAAEPDTDRVTASLGATRAEPAPGNSEPVMSEAQGRQLLDRFGLSRLNVHEGKLALNHNTRVILQNFHSAAPYEVLQAGLADIEAALAAQHGEAVATEFRVLVAQYHDYDARMAALDDELNLTTEITDQQVELARQLKITLQEEAFGYERSASLFRAEREMTEAMARHRAEFDSTSDELSEEDTRRMMDEYRAIMDGS